MVFVSVMIGGIEIRINHNKFCETNYNEFSLPRKVAKVVHTQKHK